MGFYSENKKRIEEQGLFPVLFLAQVAWMGTLGITKKGFWIRTFFVILMSPVFYLLGYGDFADKLALVGSTSYEQPLANLVASMFLFMHWMGVVFPYLLVLNVIVIFTTQMWSNRFWQLVEDSKV